MTQNNPSTCAASSRGLQFNSGCGSSFQTLDIGHDDYMALIEPDIAFWSLVRKDKLADSLEIGSSFMQELLEKRESFAEEINALRFGLKPSAVYFNPTDRCNLNCSYCYIPEDMRRDGTTMTAAQLEQALGVLKDYFKDVVPEGIKPQIIFHGAEPLVAKDAMFAGMDKYLNDFRFGVQTNGTLLDDEAVEFLTSRNIGIGLSLDSAEEHIANLTRFTWSDSGVYKKVLEAMDRLKGYPNYNVICTVTRDNMTSLTEIVEFFHEHEVPACMLNPVRCTREGARQVKPLDHELVPHFLKALDRSYELYEETGRKLTVANFANILVSIIAPTARRLMCDISPCGGGRCFFAVSASGDLFPCSEFVGVPEFNGGNLFTGNIDDALKTQAFNIVTERKVEDIDPCARCAIRHFCGSPCPAEAHEMNGGMDKPGAFCELYEEQTRYALRLIADGKHDAFLWEGWDDDTNTDIDITSI